MTIKEQLRVLDNKIRQSKADYNLSRKNAEMSALSLGKLGKYEYLTDQDLGYRPDPIQKARFEYSPLGQVFNKRLGSNERQEGLLKRLKNIEGKNEQQLDLIKDQGDRQLDLIGKINLDGTKSIRLRDERLKNLKKEITEKEKNIVKKSRSEDKEKGKQAIFSYTGTDNTHFDFNNYVHLMRFAGEVYSEELSSDEARKEAKEMLKKN